METGIDKKVIVKNLIYYALSEKGKQNVVAMVSCSRFI